jgi:hypothetical protein
MERKQVETEELCMSLRPMVTTYDDGSKFGWIQGATFIREECGCEVTGNGTLQHPLTVVRCALHSGPQSPVKVLRGVLDTLHDDASYTQCRNADKFRGIKMVEEIILQAIDDAGGEDTETLTYDPEDGGVPCVSCGKTISKVEYDENHGACGACVASD